ncbi:PTS sugar transporter subunit IIA [Bartonella sp. DGB1]|uniref:PTS sugar transporter subunit IIA n=1 Tax=Bartonella sp. DGB1 TaxID=3239807 RepID=UPI003526B686
MIGIVLVTHGQLAEEFRLALEHVTGPQKACVAVCIAPKDNIEEKRLEVLNAIEQVQDGKGVIILTDMFGGTPSNIAISAIDDSKTEIIVGVNLPMLIKLANVRQTHSLDECLTLSLEAAKKYTTIPSRIVI